jgi:hypothetical protein
MVLSSRLFFRCVLVVEQHAQPRLQLQLAAKRAQAQTALERKQANRPTRTPRHAVTCAQAHMPRRC